MLNEIYIYETRDLNYLQSYLNRAKDLNFNVTVLNSGGLENDSRFQQFKILYEHHSCNSLEFELNCFARYFNIAETLKSNNSFIISDSDIFIANRLEHLRDDSSLKDTFVGSEGYFSAGSEQQISPHFSIWNRDLINDFIEYLLEVYRENRQSQRLAGLYLAQKERLGRTGISDMTLLYMWVKARNIRFLNSNAISNTLGIDHNISALYSEDGTYQSFCGRKLLKLQRDQIICRAADGRLQNMAVLHFQGGYKRILNDFYLDKIGRFYLFSMYINYGRKINRVINKAS